MAEESPEMDGWIVVVGRGSFASCYGVFQSYDDTVWWLKTNGFTAADNDIYPIRRAAVTLKETPDVR